MAEDLAVGPFGRVLPRPHQSLSRTDSSEIQRLPVASGDDKMFARTKEPSIVSPRPSIHSQGYQLPPFNQILGHQDAPNHLNGSYSSNNSLGPLPKGSSSPGGHPAHGFADSSQARWNPLVQYGDHIDRSSHAIDSHPHPDVRSFPFHRTTYNPPGPGSPVTLPSLMAQQSLMSSSGMLPASTYPQGRRVLREEHVPGKGVFYVYEDGTTCPKAVDGELVNPEWGTTKAGKPRKRLAQACTTCREKKTKCKPGIPKCAQCTKYGRECRFEPFSRGNARSPSVTSRSQSPTMSNMTGASSLPPQGDSVTSVEGNYPSSRPMSSSKSSMTVENLLSPSAQVGAQDDVHMQNSVPENPNKRMRRSVSSPDISTELNVVVRESSRRRSEFVGSGGAGKTLDWESDPYAVDPRTTEYYLKEYFVNINTTTYCMFPRLPFMQWVVGSAEKSKWDRMLIYAMLAHGSVFAENKHKKAHGALFSKIAHLAASQSTGVFNLQVVQTRLILALYNFGLGNSTQAWDFCGSAIRAACGMRLNVEDGVNDVHDDQVLDYDLSPDVLIECRRRTFWSAYIMDRFNGFCSGHISMFHDEDCLLRLPCDERRYEEGDIPATPFFDNGITSSHRTTRHDQSGVGMMGHLVQVASIWSTVLARAYRSRFQTPEEWSHSFEPFYKQTMDRLRAWESSLPPRLRATSENMIQAEEDGWLGAFGALHTLHHCTIMKLNRHARFTRMTPEHVTRNVRLAYNHAVKTLELMEALATRDRQHLESSPRLASSSPFTGFAILTAIDILTATGTLSDLFDTQSRTMALVSGSIQVLEELSWHWSSAKRQAKLVAGRYGDLIGTVKSTLSATKIGFYASSPMEKTFGLEHDLVYAIPRKQYLEALGIGGAITNDGDLLEIRRQSASGRGGVMGRGRHTLWDNDSNV